MLGLAMAGCSSRIPANAGRGEGEMPVWMVVPSPHAHLAGTLLPRGFFLGLGLIDLAALAVDRLAARWSLPGAAAVLLQGNAHGDHQALHAAVAS